MSKLYTTRKIVEEGKILKITKSLSHGYGAVHNHKLETTQRGCFEPQFLGNLTSFSDTKFVTPMS